MILIYCICPPQALRSLENRLDKALLKLHEAEHINRTYTAIKTQMMNDSLNFGNDLDDLESEIDKQKVELKDLQAMNRDAQISRDAAKVSWSFSPVKNCCVSGGLNGGFLEG